MHDPNRCLLCETLVATMGDAAGVTEREVARLLEQADLSAGVQTATASRLLSSHGWRELPHPLTEREHGARFAPPQEVEHG